MEDEKITQQEAMVLLNEVIGSWDHYYCPKCKRNHQVSKSSILPKPSKIFVEHIEFSKNPFNKRKNWVGKKALKPRIQELILYQKIASRVQDFIG